MLEADLRLSIGGRALEANISAAPGDVVAVIGRNGAGKTTILRALAGLHPLEAGRVAFDGEVWDSPSENIYIPTERRGIGMLFQENYLFSNMSVLENVTFGLRARKVASSEARRRALELLERLNLESLASRPASELSGGESRRVAFARTFITNPKLLLLDEPLAPADAGSKPVIRRELQAGLGAPGCICILVTHDPADALTLANRLIVVDGGRVVQSGGVDAVLRHPKTDFTADFANINIYKGTAVGGIITIENGETIVAASGEGNVIVAIPASAVAVHHHPPQGSPRNAWPGVITHIETHTDRVRLHIEGKPNIGKFNIRADVTAASVRSMDLRPSKSIWVSVKATEVSVNSVENS